MDTGVSSSWEAVEKLCRDRLEAMAPTVVRLDARDDVGRLRHAASGICLQLDGVRVVATAEHVVRGLAKFGPIHVSVVDQQEEHIANGHAFLAPAFSLDPATAILLERRTGLDAAVIPVTPDLARRRCWIDAALQHDVAGRIGERVTFEDPSPVTIFGFPRFSRFVFEDVHCELTVAYPLPARVMDWPSIVASKRDMVLDVEMPEVEACDEDDEMGKAIAQQFENMYGGQDDSGSLLGGYSGAPVFHFDLNGAAVVGLITEGRVYGSNARVVAAPIDAVVDAVRSAPEWRRLVH